MYIKQKSYTFTQLLHRVRSVNPPYLQLFSKNAIKTLLMNILRRNLQVMFNRLNFIKLFKKIAASIHDILNPLAVPPGGLYHGVPGQSGHHLLDLGHQGGNILWGALLMSRSQTLHT
jgi:hypothetical protein